MSENYITGETKLAVLDHQVLLGKLFCPLVTVIRFSDNEVFNHIPAVHNYLEDWIENKIDRKFSPPPLKIYKDRPSGPASVGQ